MEGKGKRREGKEAYPLSLEKKWRPLVTVCVCVFRREKMKSDKFCKWRLRRHVASDRECWEKIDRLMRSDHDRTRDWNDKVVVNWNTCQLTWNMLKNSCKRPYIVITETDTCSLKQSINQSINQSIRVCLCNCLFVGALFLTGAGAIPTDDGTSWFI